MVMYTKSGMLCVKSRVHSFYKAKYKNIFFNILLIKEVDTCEEYLKIVLHSDTNSNYYDIYFKRKSAPYYIKNLFFHIVKNSKITLSEDEKLGYIIYGPDLHEKQIYKMTYIHIGDYHRMLSRECEFVYNHAQNIDIADKWIKPIYDDIIKKIKK